MNPLIYVIAILIGIFILYHLRENIKNLWAVKEGLSLMGKDLNKTGRCANYKINGSWVRDGVFSGGGSLEDCANRFGEDGGVFSYNDKYCMSIGGEDRCIFVWKTDILDEIRERRAIAAEVLSRPSSHSAHWWPVCPA